MPVNSPAGSRPTNSRSCPQALALVWVAGLLVTVLPATAQEPATAEPDEAAVERLVELTDSLQSLSADFEQTLYDEASEPLQSSRGSLVLQRPGRFHWQIDTPDDQLIVADGTRLWLYDKALQQVTVSPIDERVAGSPLLLLTSDIPLSEQFEIDSIGNSEGLDWLELTPREDAGDFETVYIGLDAEGLAAMELRDSFGQATQILFNDVEHNAPVDDTLFTFTPPDGVDVIGDPDIDRDG